ncbi:peptidylprolyl isomerase [Mangrovibacterium diazotrophicum]|uniref:peptidylprolyl isomerase n=1 Tax=Mangrovibacterium diazotrophicum TaxID=1261403 RepID=A0A419WA41_9BACT|nr:peptidylprolyl isomerase [Mangrovibacterium diazotrophicum]RKD92327.1 peptidyl-prolyl cis-trans isomerase B (cyclophilin B) [Mangrovibacterium diazotrophicum]
MKYFLIAVSFFFFHSAIAQNQVDHLVEIQTNFGTMRFRLYNDTPKHRDAFMQLAREGYYNETLFYRVIQNFLIQGGSRSSRNAPPGKRIGYGSPDHTVDDEIVPGHIHKKGALCAPRQPDEVNPFKQSDISQFYVVKGQVFTEGELDTMEMAVNRPIRKKIIKEVYTPEIKAQLKQLKEENKVDEFREIADRVKSDINAKMALNPNVLEFNEQQRKAYTTVGGYPDLDGKYTIFGECISGFDVIDKIAELKVDENNRPLTDVKITVKIIQ